MLANGLRKLVAAVVGKQRHRLLHLRNLPPGQTAARKGGRLQVGDSRIHGGLPQRFKDSIETAGSLSTPLRKRYIRATIGHSNQQLTGNAAKLLQTTTPIRMPLLRLPAPRPQAEECAHAGADALPRTIAESSARSSSESTTRYRFLPFRSIFGIRLLCQRVVQQAAPQNSLLQPACCWLSQSSYYILAAAQNWTDEAPHPEDPSNQRRRSASSTSLPVKELYHPRNELQSRQHFAFPHHKHIPSQGSEFRLMLGVALHIPFQFRYPLTPIGVGLPSNSAFGVFVLMPETPTHLYNLAPPRKHEILLARQASHVQPVAVTHRMQQSTDGHFRLCPLRPDPSHDLASPHFTYVVGHH